MLPRPLALLLAAAALAVCVASSVAAQDLFLADTRGDLWRYGTETPERSHLADAPAPFVGLTVDSDGELYGLGLGGEILRISPNWFGAEILQGAEPSGDYEYRDLVEDEPGEFLLLRWDREAKRSELVRWSLTTRNETLLGPTTFAGGEPFDAVALGVSSSGALEILDHRTIYALDPVTYVAQEPVVELSGLQVFDREVDPNSLRSWVLSEQIDGIPGLALLPLDASGSVDEDAVAYSFSFGLGPRALALRPRTDACPRDRFTLCLQNGRFQVRARWRDFEGVAGDGRTKIERSESAGQFWFFDSENQELLVKVVDGCGLNGRFWVILAGLTNVEVEIEILDLDSGVERTYSNALGEAFETRFDLQSFACGAPLDNSRDDTHTLQEAR